MIRLGGPDKVSIRLLEEWPGGLLYRPGVETTRDFTRAKIEEHFTDGSSVFHDGDPFERYFVQRVRNYAHLGTLKQAMIRKARSTGECHTARVIDVVDAASWLKWFKGLSQEEYAGQVFGKDFGFPPFDLICSCRMEGIIPGVEE